MLIACSFCMIPWITRASVWTRRSSQHQLNPPPRHACLGVQKRPMSRLPGRAGSPRAAARSPFCRGGHPHPCGPVRPLRASMPWQEQTLRQENPRQHDPVARGGGGRRGRSTHRAQTSGGSRWRFSFTCSRNGYLSSRGGCPNRWHSLVSCDHGDSTTIRFDSPRASAARGARTCSPTPPRAWP
jgi:hypothetical protein